MTGINCAVLERSVVVQYKCGNYAYFFQNFTLFGYRLKIKNERILLLFCFSFWEP